MEGYSRYVEENPNYLKNGKRIASAIKETSENREVFETILDKMSGGSYIDGSLDDVNEGFLGKEQIKEFIKGKPSPLGGISPIEKTKHLIKEVKSGRKAKDVLREIEEAEAMKKLEEEGDAKEIKGETDRSEKDKCKNSSGTEDWKEGVESDLKYLKVAKDSCMMASPTEILKNINLVKSKVGFIKRSKKLKKGPGDIIMSSQAKTMADMKRAKGDLFACPSKIDRARKIAENDYMTKKKYIEEYEAAKVILIEDVSGSMCGSRAEMASATIIAMMKEEMAEKLEIVDVFLMGDHVTPLKLQKQNKIAEYLKKRNKSYGGGTENLTAIIKAAERLKLEDCGEIVLLTDGSFDIGEDIAENVIQTKTKMHCLLVKQGGNSARGIKSLCQRTGGMYVQIAPPGKRVSAEGLDGFTD